MQADGKILVGGDFTSIGGQPRDFFARLSNDTAALQNLSVTHTGITWTRGGSSPQFTRVTFEYSNDNVNYTLLGNGTATGSDWTLAGLSFPIGQNFYVRARGYYRSGFQNGSESIMESVRNAFPTVRVTVQTALAGLAFNVDGTDYSAAQTFSWASGSSHTIATTSLQSGAPGVRYYLVAEDGGAMSHTVAPTNKATAGEIRHSIFYDHERWNGGHVSPGEVKTLVVRLSISATPSTTIVLPIDRQRLGSYLERITMFHRCSGPSPRRLPLPITDPPSSVRDNHLISLNN